MTILQLAVYLLFDFVYVWPVRAVEQVVGVGHQQLLVQLPPPEPDQ
jgi:hypothetical protein